MTPSYLAITERIQEQSRRWYTNRLREIKAEHERLETQLHDTTKTTQNELAALSKVTMAYLTTGIAINDGSLPWMSTHPHRQSYGHTCFDWEQYFRGLAREAKRPFVYARKAAHYKWDKGRSEYTPYWWLRMPMLKRLAPLYSALMLFDSEACRRNTSLASVMQFTLTGEEGMKVFDSWKEQCLTDVTCRRLLGTLK